MTPHISIKTLTLPRVFLAALLLFGSGVVSAKAAEPFKKGDTVRIADGTPLFFNDVALRTATGGERFTVLAHRKETGKVYVSAKDAQGKEIALNVAEKFCTPAGAETAEVSFGKPLQLLKKAVEEVKAELPAVASDKPKSKAADSTLLVTSDVGVGTAFIAQFGGKPYIVTNFHVVQGASYLQFSNSSATFKITAGEVEVADGRDLVRIPADGGAGLEISNGATIGDAVTAYGNSGGKNVVTSLDGKVQGVGPDEIEVSCPFIPGNSGGPLVDANDKVVGVATYVARDKGIPEWVKSGSRFGEARRFGVRLTESIKWMKLPFAVLQRETKQVESMKEALLNYVTVAIHFAEHPFANPLGRKPGISTQLALLVDRHGMHCQKFQAMQAKAGRSSTGPEEMVRARKELNDRHRTLLRDLSSAMKTAANDYSWRASTFATGQAKKQAQLVTTALAELAGLVAQDAAGL